LDISAQIRQEVSLLAVSYSEYSFPDREVIIPREDQVKGLSVAAHPFGREAGCVSRTYVPLLSEEDRCPRAPGFWCIIDSKAAAEACISPWDELPPEVPLQRGVVTYSGAK